MLKTGRKWSFLRADFFAERCALSSIKGFTLRCPYFLILLFADKGIRARHSGVSMLRRASFRRQKRPGKGNFMPLTVYTVQCHLTNISQEPQNVWPIPGSSPRESDSKTKLVRGLAIFVTSISFRAFFCYTSVE